jgi:hypothetical protein
MRPLSSRAHAVTLQIVGSGKQQRATGRRLTSVFARGDNTRERRSQDARPTMEQPITCYVC